MMGWRTRLPLPYSAHRSDPQAAVATFVQGEHGGAQTSVIAVTFSTLGANCAELSHGPSVSDPRPYGSIPILQERVNSEPAERRMLRQLTVLPTHQSVEGADPESSVACRHEGPDLGSPKLLPRRQWQRRRSNSVEAKHTGLSAQPEITVGRLGDCVDRPM